MNVTERNAASLPLTESVNVAMAVGISGLILAKFGASALGSNPL
jgi:hypothetical protein